MGSKFYRRRPDVIEVFEYTGDNLVETLTWLDGLKQRDFPSSRSRYPILSHPSAQLAVEPYRDGDNGIRFAIRLGDSEMRIMPGELLAWDGSGRLSSQGNAVDDFTWEVVPDGGDLRVGRRTPERS